VSASTILILLPQHFEPRRLVQQVAKTALIGGDSIIAVMFSGSEGIQLLLELSRGDLSEADPASDHSEPPFNASPIQGPGISRTWPPAYDTGPTRGNY
jgi:hypothetical protein